MHICFIIFLPIPGYGRNMIQCIYTVHFKKVGTIWNQFCQNFSFSKVHLYSEASPGQQDNNITGFQNHCTDTPCAYTSVSFQWCDSTIETRDIINLTFLLETNRKAVNSNDHTIHSSWCNIVVENLVELQTS